MKHPNRKRSKEAAKGGSKIAKFLPYFVGFLIGTIIVFIALAYWTDSENMQNVTERDRLKSAQDEPAADTKEEVIDKLHRMSYSVDADYVEKLDFFHRKSALAQRALQEYKLSEKQDAFVSMELIRASSQIAALAIANGIPDLGEQFIQVKQDIAPLLDHKFEAVQKEAHFCSFLIALCQLSEAQIIEPDLLESRRKMLMEELNVLFTKFPHDQKVASTLEVFLPIVRSSRVDEKARLASLNQISKHFEAANSEEMKDLASRVHEQRLFLKYGISRLAEESQYGAPIDELVKAFQESLAEPDVPASYANLIFQVPIRLAKLDEFEKAKTLLRVIAVACKDHNGDSSWNRITNDVLFASGRLNLLHQEVAFPEPLKSRVESFIEDPTVLFLFLGTNDLLHRELAQQLLELEQRQQVGLTIALVYPDSQAEEVVAINERFRKNLKIELIAEADFPDNQVRKTLFQSDGIGAMMFKERKLVELHVPINQIALNCIDEQN